MGFFSGIGKGFGYNSLSSFGNSAANNFISGVLERTTSMLSGNSIGTGGLNSEASNAKSMVKAALRIRYAQGWQWAIEVDGQRDFNMFAKDITYSSVTIETESKQIGAVVFNKPTHRDAGSITVTVRDTESGEIASWFDERASRVINPDGTVNLSSQYSMGIRIYRVMQDGGTALESEFEVFPTSRGETTRARDQVTEFLSYPLTFIKVSSVESGLSSLATSALSKATSGSLNPNNIIKY